MNQIGRPKNYRIVATDEYRQGWERIFGAKQDTAAKDDGDEAVSARHLEQHQADAQDTTA